MTQQVIVYTNTNGGVSVCIPTGEIPIADVQAKDTPQSSVIIDAATLPQGTDAQFFDAWKLSGSTVSVDIPTAVKIQTAALNQLAYAEGQHRAAKVAAGLTNVMADADWTAALTTARAAVTAATTTAALVSAIQPIQTAIAANASL